MNDTSFHVLTPEDSARIRCQGSPDNPFCDARATKCLHVRWTIPSRPPRRGISFFYACDADFDRVLKRAQTSTSSTTSPEHSPLSATSTETATRRSR